MAGVSKKTAKTKKTSAKKRAKPTPVASKTSRPVEQTVDKPVGAPATPLTTKQHLLRLIATKPFAVCYLLASLVILTASTLLWTLLSARLQSTNADQIVDQYLFQYASVFHNAAFPAAHSFLLKWPIFWLVDLFGVSSASLISGTVVVVLLTVAGLVWAISRLERRPLVLGTICLALASCLLLVPAQPAPGTLLPVNMAMLATRNLEYVVYLQAVVLLVRTKRTRSWRFATSALLLGLLAASDRLFLYMSLGGAIAALLIYALRRDWKLVESTAHWLVAGLVGGAVALVVLALLQAMHVTHIVSGASGGNPYQAVHSLKDFIIACLYAVLGLMANFGANPASSALAVGNIAHQTARGLFSFAGPAYLINLLIMVLGVVIALRLVIPTVAVKATKRAALNRGQLFSLALIWTSLAALGLFVLSDHYYPVDARYLTIALFAVLIAVATWSRTHSNFRPEYVALAGGIIVIGMILALPAVIQNYHDGQLASADINTRNHLVSEALNQHHVDVLVGDYWRVIPARLAGNNQQTILPLANCTQARDTLTTKSWQPSLSKHSFAYLLSYDHGLADFPQCNLNQVVDAYGRPNASIIIAGNFAHPKEVLLFYDHGKHQYVPPSTRVTAQPLASVIPINLDELPGTSCDGPTDMNVVAHQDDDLLFMNPDLLHDIEAGHCVRTVYITAGDAGQNQFYWLSRQQGSEDAYATMLHTADRWSQRIVKLNDSSYVTVLSSMGNSKVSLLFVNLPDGGLNGQGFGDSHGQSLAKLESGQISSITTVDHESSYTKSQLTATLATLFHAYQPAEIRTQASDNESTQYPDHSDHLAVGRITRSAYQKYEADQYENQVTIPISYYIGYPIHSREANVEGEDLQRKAAAFFAYAKHDGGVCHSMADCMSDRTVYGIYLTRQYQE